MRHIPGESSLPPKANANHGASNGGGALRGGKAPPRVLNTTDCAMLVSIALLLAMGLP